MTIERKIDFRYEAIALINKVVTNNLEDDRIVKNYIGYGLDYDTIKSMFKNYSLYKDEIVKDMNTVKDDFLPFFDSFLDNTVFISDFYIYYKNSELKNKEEILDKFYINHLENLINEEIDEISVKKVIEIVNQSDIDNNYKLLLINFYVNFDSLYEELLKYIDSVAYLIEKKYHLIEEDVNSFYNEITNTSNLTEKLNRIMKSDFFTDNYNITITIFSYNKMNLISTTELDNYHIYLGYLLFKLDTLKKENIIEEKKLLNVLKAISEPTRFKILRMLREKSMYAQEIAKQIGLTSATLIHHLEILVNEGIIFFIKNDDKKKIYYQVQVEAIKDIINTLERSLL